MTHAPGKLREVGFRNGESPSYRLEDFGAPPLDQVAADSGNGSKCPRIRGLAFGEGDQRLVSDDPEGRPIERIRGGGAPT